MDRQDYNYNKSYRDYVGGATQLVRVDPRVQDTPYPARLDSRVQDTPYPARLDSRVEDTQNPATKQQAFKYPDTVTRYQMARSPMHMPRLYGAQHQYRSKAKVCTGDISQ